MPPAASFTAAGGNALAALVEAAQAHRSQVTTPSRAVTVRLPENLLERVDRVVFETGMKKQDLFEHAVRAAVEAVEAALPRRR
jgi:predicted DNA binding CopG/RHH family protein